MDNKFSENEIQKNAKKEDKKHILPFVLLMIVSFVIGGCIGYFGFKWVNGNIDNIYEQLGEFYVLIAPYIRLVLIAFMVIYVMLQITNYRKCKKEMMNLDLENEEDVEKFGKKLSNGMIISNTGFMGVILLGGTGFYCMPKTLENTSEIVFFIAWFCYFIILIMAIAFQNIIFNMSKQLNPEKNVSTYDMKFQKKLIENCDEAEKYNIYKQSYRSFSLMNHKVYPVVTFALMIIGMLFEIGMLPFIISAMFWIISQAAYFTEAKNK